MTSPIRAAFNQGAVPTIACFNKATTGMGVGVDFPTLVAALQVYLDTLYAPVWGTPATLQVSEGFVPGAWAMAFLETADVANALGYHDLTPEGLPFSKVFVATSVRFGESVSVTASHELAEMLVDPAVNLLAATAQNVMYAYETADAVEEVSIPVMAPNGDQVAMSDFVYPSWFEGFRAPGSAQFDAAGQVQKPFGLLPGGYAIIFKRGRWRYIFGSKEKAKRFAKEDRRGHRSTYRGRRRAWRPSAPTDGNGPVVGP